VFDSSLSPDECRKALETQTATLWGAPVLRGLIPRGDGLILRARHTFLNNSFQTLADVKLRPGGHGTLVEVTLRSSYFVSAFMTLWLGFVIVFSLVVVAGAVSHPQELGFVGVTLAFLAFGFGILALGRLLSAGDRNSLLEFVRMVLSTE
jgi:hypothetical protein